MKSAVFALLLLLSLGTSTAQAQFQRFNWTGTQRLVTNDCRQGSLPKAISARLREESLDPIAYVRELSSGLIF